MRKAILVACLLTSVVHGHETTCNIRGVLSGPLEFKSGYIYYVHPEVLEDVTQLTLQNLEDTTIHFLGPISGAAAYQTSYRDDLGVVNIVDCKNLLISGLDVTNTKVFARGNMTSESSCAVNISRSSCTLQRANLTGNGKITLAVHSGSVVQLLDSSISGYYFELFIAGSDLSAEGLVINQHNVQFADSHSAMLASSSHRHATTNVLYQNTNVDLSAVTFNMTTGRAIVSGNGSYTTRSHITLTDPVLNVGPIFGIATWHRNFNSITVTLNSTLPGLVDYVSTPDSGLGRFINYYSPPTRPNPNSPIFVDGVSSDDIQQ